MREVEVTDNAPLLVTLVSRASLIVADAIVVMLTFAATHGQYRTQDVLHIYGRMETLTGAMCTNG